jgi:hypothetical protein
MFDQLVVWSWLSGSLAAHKAPAAPATASSLEPKEFRYVRQLNSTKNEIRLLLLQPACNENEPLRARLKVVSLPRDTSDSSPPAYTALSYT